MSEKPWLNGYYPPDIDKAGGFEKWQEDWSMGPHSDEDWVWFNGENCTEEQARKILKEKPWGIKAQESDSSESR